MTVNLLLRKLEQWACRVTGRFFRYRITVRYRSARGEVIWWADMGIHVNAHHNILDHRYVKRGLWPKGIKKDAAFSEQVYLNGKIEIVPTAYLGWM